MDQIPIKYSLIRVIGTGAYGVVISALDKETGQKVAIKKISRAFEDPVDAKRILREIKLMKVFSHENVCDRRIEDSKMIYIISPLF